MVQASAWGSPAPSATHPMLELRPWTLRCELCTVGSWGLRSLPELTGESGPECIELAVSRDDVSSFIKLLDGFLLKQGH